MNTQNQMAMDQVVLEDLDVARAIATLMRQGAAFYLHAERGLDVTINVPGEEIGTRWTGESRQMLEDWRNRIEEHFQRIIAASGVEMESGKMYRHPYVPDPSAA